MSEINNELKKLINLLHIEKDEDLLQYTIKMADTSLPERRRQGVCWYPVMLENTRFNAGERLVVSVRRPEKYREPHLFQSGKPVSVFHAESEQKNSVSGVINNVTRDHMLITLNSDEEPYWMHRGRIGVQLLFDEGSYREMHNALKKMIKADEASVNKLKQILLGNVRPLFGEKAAPAKTALNPSQNHALSKVINADALAVIHGPPGTGKTTTLIEAITETAASEKQVLVCAPSNNAVDLLVEKLSERGVGVLRIGHPARVTEEMLEMTLDARVAAHKDYKNMRAMRKKADEYFGMAKKYKRSFGHTERQQRKLLYKEAHWHRDAADNLDFYITNDIVENAEVIACTLIGANNHAIRYRRFKTVFIDEAAQAMEPATWIPVMKADRVVFAGDHCQLPPTVKSGKAAGEGLAVSLFEKAVAKEGAATLLEEQYRMHESIMNFSNGHFYKGRLIANEAVARRTVFEGDSPLEFIDTAGTGYHESVNPETKSSFNEGEAELIRLHFEQYMHSIRESGADMPDVGIIAPYKAQVATLKKTIDTGTIDGSKITINTIDGFQGQERDIIYLSLVRSNETGEIGFLSDERRMNVAMTRAKKKLVIVGDSSTIGQSAFYGKLLDYAEAQGACHTAFEWPIRWN